MRRFTFTVVDDNGDVDYLTYKAYSLSQAYFFLEMDGFSPSRVIDREET